MRNNEINRLYATGRYTYEQLGKKFNLSKSAIGLICKDVSRKEVKRKQIESFFKDSSVKVRPTKNYKSHIALTTGLIESMSDYADAHGWEDDVLIKRLTDLGITRRDFELAGYSEFVREYFEKTLSVKE